MLPLVAPDRDAFFSGIATAGLRTGAAAFTAGFAVVLPAGFAFTAALTGGFAVLTALDLLAVGVFALVVFATGFVDFTALLAGVFFTEEEADFAAAFNGFASALTTLPARAFTDDFAGVFFAAGLRATAAFLGAVFFALLADFVTVAFIVPCP
ncbi:MAG TPA: hypothetical protein VN114_12855 [Oxalicibacterium sp.]|uniref:hypothetical protein n=1 Tax=Oxalicibacterium sp. TaxID=2766525 RepID=UPI002CC559AA|nr:hypothetical protein [Oxalicibacterium sp.]HWU99397.1 hypothetical protein [Oxalicibacterium sp.]